MSENELFLISNEVKVGYNRLTGKVSFFSINDLSLLNEKDYGTQFTKRHDGKECAYEVRQAFMLAFNLNFYFLIKVLDGKNLSKFYGLGLVEFLYFPLSITARTVSV